MLLKLLFFSTIFVSFPFGNWNVSASSLNKRVISVDTSGKVVQAPEFSLSSDSIHNRWWKGTLITQSNEIIPVDFYFAVNSITHKINGSCTISYPKTAWDDFVIFSETIKIIDSLAKLEDQLPELEYLHHGDSISRGLRYHETFPVTGRFDGDSIFFQVDTIYSDNNLERHVRFQGKCMKWGYIGHKWQGSFIQGSFIDSSFQQFPLCGSFIAIPDPKKR